MRPNLERSTRRWPATLCVLVALLALTAPGLAQERPGRVILVAREKIEDAGFREELEGIGGEDATRFVLALSTEPELPGVDRCFAPESRDVVFDRELCERLEEVDVLVIRGGTFMQWFKTLFPEDGSTYLARTLVERVRNRRMIVAHGGACAFLCNGTSVPREDLVKRERNPRRRGAFVPRVAMGLVPKALIDSDDTPGGSPFRLLQALWETRLDLGFHLVGDVALDYRREGGKVLVLGPGAVVACDLDRARRQTRAVREARVSLLRRGDGWDEVFDQPFVAGGRRPTPPGPTRRGEEATEAPLLERAPALVAALETLVASTRRRTHHIDGPRRLELDWNEATRSFEGSSGVALLHLSIDVFWE